jgi:hypothetical protein
MSDAFKKSLLEFLRVFAMTGVAELLRICVSGEFAWQTSALAVVIPLLRFVDKWLHESGVAEKGLTRF